MRLTVKLAQETMRQHNWKLKSFVYFERRYDIHYGCAAALYFVAYFGDVDKACSEMRKFVYNAGVTAENHGLSRDYVEGLESGFEQNPVLGFKSRGVDFRLGYEDGKNLR